MMPQEENAARISHDMERIKKTQDSTSRKQSLMENPWMRQRSFEKCWVLGVTPRKMRSPWMLKSITVRKKRGLCSGQRRP
jgi:hypothetical protein